MSIDSSLAPPESSTVPKLALSSYKLWSLISVVFHAVFPRNLPMGQSDLSHNDGLLIIFKQMLGKKLFLSRQGEVSLVLVLNKHNGERCKTSFRPITGIDWGWTKALALLWTKIGGLRYDLSSFIATDSGWLAKPHLVGGLGHFLFSIIYEIILPIDFHIFQDG